MPNQIHNCGMTLEEILEPEEEREKQTKEKAAEAFNDMFEEAEEKFNKMFNNLWKKTGDNNNEQGTVGRQTH